MNWLAQINLKAVVNRLGAFRSFFLLLTLIITCLYSGYRLGNYYHNYQQTLLTQQQKRLDSLYQNVDEQVSRINTLEVELAVERLANQKIQSAFKDIESEHYKVKTDLAFYEKVMAPEKEADGLVIDGVTVNATESERHYNFQVILVQQLLKKRFAKGYVEIVLQGSLDNKPISLPLSKLSKLTKKDLAFSFQYFQIVEGEITLPENFIPEFLVVSAVLPKGKWQKYNRVEESHHWQKILKITANSVP